MKRRTSPWAPVFVTALAIGAPASAQDGAGAVGSWVGTLVAGPQEIEIRFHIVLGEDGRLGGSMDVPTQGATGIPLTTVSFDGGVLTMTFPVPGGGSYEGALEQDRLSGTFTQAGQPFPMELARLDETTPPPARPQNPTHPLPYVVEEVRFENPDAGIELAGTLTLPEGPGPFPAAVLVSGSGPQDRDESIAGHKPFLVLSDHLTRAGVAVLRYDDRGVAESTGDFASATSEDFASDALAAIAYLGDDRRIQPSAIGIVGHSEGGLVGPMAASRSPTVKYVVMLAGPGATGLEILVEQGRLINEASGADPEMTEFNVRIQTRLAEIVGRESDSEAAAAEMRSALVDELGTLSADTRQVVEAQLTDEAIDQTVSEMNSPWFRFFLHYDPRTALARTDVPVLALFGEKDLQVPPEQSASQVEEALRRAGNDDVTVRVLPDLNHLFQEAGTGAPSEYQTIEQTFSPDALSAISEWISARFEARPPGHS